MELGANQFADPELGTERQDTEGDRQTPLPPSIDATVRAPLDYAHTAIAVMAALSRSEAVDADALPVDLQRKARARGDDLDNIVSEQLTTRHRRDIAWTEIARAGRFVEPIVKCGAPAAAGFAVVLMAGQWWRHSGATVVEILHLSNTFGYRYRPRRGSTAGAVRAPARGVSAALGVHRR